MKINSIVSNFAKPSFRALYATTSTKNHGDCVDREVITPFQKTTSEIANSPYASEFIKYRDGIDRIDAYVLMAGEGSRFRELSHKISPEHTKIGFGTPILDEEGNPTGKRMHAADFQLAMASVFSDDDGIQRINADVAKGTFAEIMTNALKLREAGKEQNNVLLMCGDNNFDVNPDDPYELMRFVTNTVDNPNKIMALFGAKRSPEAVVKTFGVLSVEESDQKGIMTLKGFVEKPATLEIAQDLMTQDGDCIANTGVVLFKKEAMEYIVDKVLEHLEKSSEPQDGFIAKNEKEPYDFAIACQKVLAAFGPEACDVKAVETWEDMGEPKALYDTLGEIQNGCFIGVLPKDMQEPIVRSINKVFDGKTLLLSDAAVKQYGTAKELTSLIEQELLEDNDDVIISNVEGVNIASDNLDVMG